MSKKEQPWRKFYSKDWRGDAPLRMCSFAARGLWVDLLSLMHESKHCGFLFVDEVVPTPRQLAGLLGGSEKEIKALLAELAAKGVFSVTGQDMPDDVKGLVPAGMPDGVMLSRRMVRDEARAEKERGNGGSAPSAVTQRFRAARCRRNSGHAHSVALISQPRRSGFSTRGAGIATGAVTLSSSGLSRSTTGLRSATAARMTKRTSFRPAPTATTDAPG